ncbi:hypothetical protein K469DRAFT_709830 [Zopfia rhizophila CBS 207.26]|uniref:Uncharacterized protein n=1 Tax=Zopfia rhizophila CBS 207.26 TaxID=1314779 RepID=A0A6A6EQ56_9PEZI|nr:hypothetical protein K469DRAFT_709830 [Zopfia rhizophila CBS 207.26]
MLLILNFRNYRSKASLEYLLFAISYPSSPKSPKSASIYIQTASKFSALNGFLFFCATMQLPTYVLEEVLRNGWDAAVEVNAVGGLGALWVDNERDGEGAGTGRTWLENMGCVEGMTTLWMLIQSSLLQGRRRTWTVSVELAVGGWGLEWGGGRSKWLKGSKVFAFRISADAVPFGVVDLRHIRV